MQVAPVSHTESTDTFSHHCSYLFDREFCCLFYNVWQWTSMLLNVLLDTYNFIHALLIPVKLWYFDTLWGWLVLCLCRTSSLCIQWRDCCSVCLVQDWLTSTKKRRNMSPCISSVVLFIYCVFLAVLLTLAIAYVQELPGLIQSCGVYEPCRFTVSTGLLKCCCMQSLGLM